MTHYSHALIIGAGRSGVAAARLLLKHGSRVTLFDDQPEEKLRYFNDSALAGQIGLKTVFNRSDYVFEADSSLVVLSPGVALDHKLVLQAKRSQIPILNEIEVALSFKPDLKIIGITGTNGKSTATMMMQSILTCAGLAARAGGNLGVPLCDLIGEHDFDHLVLELSSFQLETLSTIKLDVAIILNITPDHLDRYPSMKAYSDAKMRILRLLKPQGHAVLNQELKYGEGHSFSAGLWGKGAWGFLQEGLVKGLHNQENALAVAMSARLLGLSEQAIIDGLNNFTPLEFRCQLIAHKKGLTFINDSKGTTVVAVEKALSTALGPVHLLLGGQDKGESFASLTRFPEVSGFYIYGQSQAKIFKELADPRARCFINLREAFEAATKHALPGSTLMLSPGCTSYDQFADYVERGQLFNQLVDEY